MFKKLLSTRYFLLAIVLIIAAFFRFYNITHLPPGLYPDEAMNGNNALEAIATGNFKLFYPENTGREGLFINIQSISLAIFGNEPWALRIASALFGIFTVLGIYFLTKELFYKNPHFRKIALLSSFFVATSFWHINFSRIGFRAIMAPFFLTWGIYFLLSALNKIQNGLNLKFIIPSIMGGIFYGLGFHSYIAYRATPLLILIILLFYWLQNKNWQIRKKILLSTFYFLLFTFIVAAPLGLYFLKNPQDFLGRTSQISIFNSPTPIKDLSINVLKTAGMFNFVGDFNWRHNIAGKPLLFWPVGILFIIGIIFGLINVFKNQKSGIGFWVLFSWLIVAVLPIVISNEGLPHALRAILMIPPVFILAGFSGIWLMEKINPPTGGQKSTILNFIIYASLFVIFILFVLETYNSYFIKWGKNSNVQGAFAADYVQIGRKLRDLPNELPKYVIVEAGGFDVRGIPMPSHTIMFITDTFTSQKQKEKNLYYLLPDQINQIPQSSYSVKLK